MPRKLRVGVAGAGFIGTVHARAYTRVPDVELVGVADPVEAKAGALAKETGCRPFRDYAELLREGLDILSVCLPPQPHLAAAEAAAAAGTHVLMEKPIARTVEEADAMVAACRRAGVSLMTGFTHHFYPEMRAAHRLVREGAIGTPLSVLDNMSITYAFVLPWYRDRDVAGGGVFMCNAVHGFDRAAWVLGQRVTTVAALVEPTAGSKGEDFGSALARFDGGAQGTFFQHWGPYRTLTCELTVYGDEGMLLVRSWDSIELLRGGKRTVEHFYAPDMSFPERTMVGMVDELAEMAAAVREGRAPSPAGEEGRTSVALVHAVYRAAAERTWVDV
jgi:predicted dehydrogenase